MTEQNNEWKRDDSETSLSKMASSFYKMQLGVNSVRDELKILNDCMLRIAEALEKK